MAEEDPAVPNGPGEPHGVADAQSLLLAVRNGDATAVQDVLSSHPEYVDSPDPDGITPLMFAAYCDQGDVCGVLIEARADLSREDASGMSPLMHASSSRSVECCTLLLGCSASVNVADRSERSPLMHAVDAADGVRAQEAASAHEVCSLLLERRAAIDHQDSNGCTALLLAAIAGSSALLPLLLQSGANIKLADNFGSSALDYARAEGHDVVAELLAAADRAEDALQACVRQRELYDEAKASFDVEADEGQLEERENE